MGLQLRLRELCARAETNTLGNEQGVGRMYLGGVALELSGARRERTVHKIRPFKVGEFDDRARRTYNPPRLFGNYGSGPEVFPKQVAMAFLLAEVGSGEDLYGAFNDLVRRMEVAERRTRADAADGRGPGSGIPGLADPWPETLGVVIKAVSWVYDEWKGDEIFAPKIEQFTLESEAHTWAGRKTSPVREVTFQGHGGAYILKYDLHMQDG